MRLYELVDDAWGALRIKNAGYGRGAEQVFTFAVAAPSDAIPPVP